MIRKTTINKFGLVRSVKPSLVFELGFEGINESSRHKSGIAVRFPRMLRIRDDKPIHEANTLAELQALLPPRGTLSRQPATSVRFVRQEMIAEARSFRVLQVVVPLGFACATEGRV